MVLLIVALSMILIDLYFFKGLFILFDGINHSRFKKVIYISYWTISILMISIVFIGIYLRPAVRNIHLFTYFYYYFGLFLILYVPKIVFIIFHLADDFVNLIKWLYKTFLIKEPSYKRLKLFSKIGFLLALIPFFLFIGGILFGRFDFKVVDVPIRFNNLPQSFNGFKVVQISDLHIGSFEGFPNEIEKAVDLVNAQKPDLILFTGDLVNCFYDELDGFSPILNKLHAKYGKYAVLGNHDYGNYYKWPTPQMAQDNFQKIKDAYKTSGFTLLNNASQTIEINGEKIALIGVENWGLPPFPQTGDYDLASKDVKEIPFKILMSHDPNHWERKIIEKTDVTLTLSGHTHGMQLGIPWGKKKWSPAKYKYKYWGGLVKKNKQYLYVNTGLGFIGYPGRVFMPPEITVFQLFSK
jgi:uncharacterized protein